MPFIHLYSSTNGELRPCCIAGSFDVKVNLKDGVESAFNSVQMKKLRQDMLEGKRNSVCNVCYNSEDNGIPSSRQMYNMSISNDFNNDGYVMPSVNEDFSVDSDFQYIDVRFSNLCNFKCIMCTHEFSSQWHDDMGFEDPYQNDGRYQKNHSKIINISDNILDDLKPHLSKLKKVYFAGGEPLIMKENYELLRFIKNNSINSSHPKKGIELYYNTNLSTLAYQGDSYMDYWKDFKKVYISISCDGLGKVGEYQRVGFNTEKLISNIEILKHDFEPASPDSHSIRFGYGFQYTVTSINVWHIFDFVDFLKEQDIITEENQITFFNAFGYYGLQNLSDSEKTKIEKFLLENLDRYENDYFINSIKNLVTSMKTEARIESIEKVKRFTEYLDIKNNQNYYEVTQTKFENDLENS